MPAIRTVRAILLSAPYENPATNMEARVHLPTGYRTCGMVELALDDGTTGIGEGYLAVFAPQVFVDIVKILEPYLIGADVDDHDALMQKLATATGYWSLQGAAQHAISAVDIALYDCRAKRADLPVYALLGGKCEPLRLYASGGDALGVGPMAAELDEVERLGINTLKIRARKDNLDKAVWCARRGAERGIDLAVDMTQNMAITSQTIDDAVSFVTSVHEQCGLAPVFLEEALGPDATSGFPELCHQLDGISKVAGGEIVTTAREMVTRIDAGYYGIAQPDATVIGGITATVEIFDHCRSHPTDVYVHCWGGPVGMMANYHAALARGGPLVEWPMTNFDLRDAMVAAPWRVEGGELHLSDVSGLGIELTAEIEASFPFRKEALYRCAVDPATIPTPVLWE